MASVNHTLWHDSAEESCDAQFTDYLVETISLILLPVAVLMCAYALTVFIWRARAIAKKQVGAADSIHGPHLAGAASGAGSSLPMALPSSLAKRHPSGCLPSCHPLRIASTHHSVIAVL